PWGARGKGRGTGLLVAMPAGVEPEAPNAAEPLAMLNTRPVGAPSLPSGSAPGAGIETVSPTLVPSVRYSVETPAPLSETQNGEPVVPGDSPTPHGLTRLASTGWVGV